MTPSGHDNDEKLDVYVYWGKSGFDSAHRTSLPTNSGVAVAMSDLNADGHPDLIVANEGWDAWRTLEGELNSYIYWGSASGFDPAKRTELPTQAADAIAVADLNADGHPEIVFSNCGQNHSGHDHFNKSYIYWNDKGQFPVSRRTELKTIRAKDVKIADLNRDSFPDIVFANEGNTVDESGAIVLALQNRNDIPDHIYLFETEIEPWTIWVLKRDGEMFRLVSDPGPHEFGPSRV